MPLGGRNSASLHQAFRGLAFASSLGWVLSVFAAVPAQAGYAIHEMVGWAQGVTELQRGPVDIANPEWGTAGYGAEADVLGPAAGDNLTVLSLGDGGFITLEFDPPIGNGPGDDFAVFENGFYDNATGELFGEFAFVEVSSNGVDFARFATETTRTSPVASGGTVEAADYWGFAGVDPAGLGTGFDLNELVGHPLQVTGSLDVYDIAFVRVVDVIGDGSTTDDLANPVYDPYSTPFASGGFDLDGIGAIHVPEPALSSTLSAGLLLLGGLARRRRARHRPPHTTEADRFGPPR